MGGIHAVGRARVYIDDYAFLGMDAEGAGQVLEASGRPLTLVEKRVAFTNLMRRSRSDLLNRSALSMVTCG